MSEPTASDVLARLLELTREDEVDCDAFLDQIAAFVEGKVHDPALHALLEHHRVACPECAEALAILRRALVEG